MKRKYSLHGFTIPETNKLSASNISLAELIKLIIINNNIYINIINNIININ